MEKPEDINNNNLDENFVRRGRQKTLNKKFLAYKKNETECILLRLPF